MALKTDYKDYVADGARKYRLTANADGTTGIEDATAYAQQGDRFGAADINATNAAVNTAAGAAAAAQTKADAAMPKAGGAFTGTVRRTGETAAHLGGEFYNVRVVSSDYDTVLGGYRFIDFQLK